MRPTLKIAFMGAADNAERLNVELKSNFDQSHTIDMCSYQREIPENGAKKIDGLIIDLDNYQNPSFQQNPFVFIQSLRDKYSGIPIIGLSKQFNPSNTDEPSTKDAVHMFQSGLDDGFDITQGNYQNRILAERFKRCFERYQTTYFSAPDIPSSDIVSENVIITDGIRIDAINKTVEFSGQFLNLSKKQFKALFFLASDPYILKSRNSIMEHIYNNTYVYDRTIDNIIRHIRSKAKKAGFPEMIKTARGRGYYFISDESRREYMATQDPKKAPKPVNQ